MDYLKYYIILVMRGNSIKAPPKFLKLPKYIKIFHLKKTYLKNYKMDAFFHNGNS